nr:hypothetical protein [Brevibacillus laterosporus]
MDKILVSAYRGASVFELFSISNQIQHKLAYSTEFDPITTSLLTVVWPAPISSMPYWRL